MNNVVVLVGRILLAALFILAGFGKLTDSLARGRLTSAAL